MTSARIFRSMSGKTISHPLCRLKEFRLKLNLSEPEMAERCGISVSGLWKIELGTNVSLLLARKLAQQYHATVDELWPISRTRSTKNPKKPSKTSTKASARTAKAL